MAVQSLARLPILGALAQEVPFTARRDHYLPAASETIKAEEPIEIRGVSVRACLAHFERADGLNLANLNKVLANHPKALEDIKLKVEAIGSLTRDLLVKVIELSGPEAKMEQVAAKFISGQFNKSLVKALIDADAPLAIEFRPEIKLGYPEFYAAKPAAR